MKYFIVFCLIASISCYGFLIPAAAVAEINISQHMPTEKILEFSLLSLKESIQKTRQKNERLAFENEALRQSIQEFQQTLDFLVSGKGEVSEQKVQRSFSAEMVARAQRTQELIEIFEQDIAELNKRVQSFDNILSEDKARLLAEKKEQSQKNLRKRQRQLEVLEKKNAGPQRVLEGLTVKQKQLVREIDLLEKGSSW